MSEVLDTGFCEFRDRLVSPALRAIVDYCRHARGDKPMPAWSDLSPGRLAPYFKLLWAFKYDNVAGDFTARLASNRTMVAFGKSFRGIPLRDIHPPHIFALAQAHMTKVVTGPMAYYYSGCLFKVGTQIVEGERIMLPLASDGRNPDGVLGATDFPVQSLPGLAELLPCQGEWFSI